MTQVLQTSHPYPFERSFVIKLHRDAALYAGELSGRIVHLLSDERAEFDDEAGLLRGLQALIRSRSCDPPAVDAGALP